jgi:hypothetical protein
MAWSAGWLALGGGLLAGAMGWLVALRQIRRFQRG